MVVDLDAVSAWTNGAATWSMVGALSRPEAPQELWMETENVDTTVRRVTAQLGEEPDELWTIDRVAASFSSRPVQVGLVAILFVGAAVAVAVRADDIFGTQLAVILIGCLPQRTWWSLRHESA